MQEKQMVKSTIDKEAIYVPLIICLYIALTSLKELFCSPVCPIQFGVFIG